MSIFAHDTEESLVKAIKKLGNKEYLSRMLASQRKIINRFANEDICDYIENKL